MLQSRSRFWLLVVLLAANLVVGVLSLYFLRSVNERYAVQFENSVPVINTLRTLSRDLAAVQRLARQIGDSENVPVAGDLSALLDELEAKVRVHALEISRRDLLKGTAPAAAIVSVSREYDEKVDQLRALTVGQKFAESRRFNLETLRPCADRFQVALDAAAMQVEQQDNGLRDRYAKDSRFFGGLALAFAGWPVLLALLAVLTLGLLVLALLITVFTPSLDRRRSVPPTG